MTLDEIQELINSNQIDLRKLDSQRLNILDGLQKKGELQTRPITDILSDQKKVADQLALQKAQQDDPIRAATGDILNRDTVASVFEVGTFLAQLMMDRTRLAKIVANPTKYASIAKKLKPDAFEKTTNQQFANALKNIDKTVGLDPSTVLGPVMRGVVAATAGYTAGAQAYDIADEIIRAKEGITTRGYKGRDINENPFVQMADDAATGLAWSAGVELLNPIAFGASKLVRQFLGLDGSYAAKIKELAKSTGLQADAFMAADPRAPGGGILTGFLRVFGQVPYVGSPAEFAKQIRVGKFTEKIENIFGLQPNTHIAQLGTVSEEAGAQLKNNYLKFKNLSDNDYTLFKSASDQFGDPLIIPMNFQRQYYNYIKLADFTPTEFKMGLSDQTMLSAIGRFRFDYENLLKREFISPNEFLGLQKKLNAAIEGSPKNEELINTYTKIREAMEKDFGSINLDPTKEVFVKNIPANQAIADQVMEIPPRIKTTIGQVTGAQGAKLNADAITRLDQLLKTANKNYSENIVAFDSPLADKVRRTFDRNIFSAKQAEGFADTGAKEADQLAKTLADHVFMAPAGRLSYDAMNDLKSLLGADHIKKIKGEGGKIIERPTQGTKAGNATVERLFSSYLADAYQKSFLRATEGENFIFDLLGRERTFQQARIPARTISELKLPNGDSVDQYIRGNIRFDPDTFRSLVLPNADHIKKFEIIYGPEKGKQMVKELENYMAYMSALNKIDVPSSSTFLARRLILGGGITLASGFYGMEFMSTVPLIAMAHFTTRFLSSPNRLKAINSSLKTYLEAVDSGDLDLAIPAMRRAIGSIAKVMSNDYPNDPRKFTGRDVSTPDLLNFLINEKFQPDKLNNLNFDPKEKERLFPTIPKNLQSKILPPPEIDDLFRPIGGAPANQDEEILMAEAVRRAPAGPLQAALPRLPGIPMPPLQPQAVTPQRYAAAFPTDTLGILAAQRREDV